jgi:hypothetical protein
MNRFVALTFLASTLAAAGCADKASMDARYDASLQRWRGATRAELEAAWGKPMSEAASGGGVLLTWIVRTDIDGRPGPDAPPAVIVSRSGGGVSTTVRSVGVAAPGPAVVPITCTTQFTLKDGRVESWRFEGMGCGAPT